MSDRLFGVSSHLFHHEALTAGHLAQIAEQGFDVVEVFATRSHFDYRDPAAVEALGTWLADTGLQLHSMHAPIVDAMRDGQWVGAYSNAATDARRAEDSVNESLAALDVARVLPYRYLVVHLGLPGGADPASGDNDPGQARRSLDRLAEHAATLGVQLALEVIPNRLSTPEALTTLVEGALGERNLGVCLDYGHAHMMGGVADAIETLSGHLFTTHVHDNGGTSDDHLVPFDGTIDWSHAMMETQKVGYDGAFIFEVADTGDATAVLRRTAAARRRLEQQLITF